ncbi:hypothetical protein KGQ31_03250, partial [Patescibacteria group bacterium]|nr:hypothetical protein [Patescibacteria group bacterium]
MEKDTQNKDKKMGSASDNPLVAKSDGEQAPIPEIKLTPDEMKYRNELIKRLILARDQRDRYHPELDNMTYIEYYESNRRKDLSYLPPKTNKQDVRIVTGTTREKDTTILTALLNMNLEPEITAFDPDDMVVSELGDNMTDLVKKSLEIEDWYKQRATIYREMISQGDVFVEELHVEDFRHVPVENLDWNPNDPEKNPIAGFSFKERLTKVFDGCKRRMVNGKKIYLGNIRCPFIEDQSLAAVLNVIPRTQAESIYGQWERWKYVPRTINVLTAWYDDGITYKDWNLITLNDHDKVAEIKVYLPHENRFMILLNGIPMLPINYPLTAISPTGEIPLSQGKNEPISDFAYSKSQPSKTKIDQEVLDEVTKLMVEKFRQMVKPPMGSKGKKVYSSSVFLAGKITYDIGEGDLFPMLPAGAAGITAPEFQFYNIIKKSIEDKTASAQMSGDQSPGDQTATETIEL